MSNDLDFSAMHERMQWYIDQEIMPCISTLVMRGLDVLDYRCFGYMDLESKTPLREDAIYRMFSNTKLVTSVALMMLCEQGKIQLDDRLDAYIPVFADLKVLVPGAKNIDDVEGLKSSITIRQVLSHSAGFSYGFVDPFSTIDRAYLKRGLNIMDGFDGSLEDLCNKLAEFPLAYQPGTGWAYSLATDVAARLVEVVSGQSFDVFLKENIFTPLGMHDTGFCVEKNQLDRLITMSVPNNVLKPMEPGITMIGKPGKGPTQPPKFLSGGGGLYSTVADYLSFVRMLVNGGEWNGARILETATIAEMRSNQLAEGVRVKFPTWDMPGTAFGLGFAIKVELSEGEPEAALGEYHWGGMAGTHSWMSPMGAPDTNISGLCMTQLMPAFWHLFSRDFKQHVYTLTSEK